MYKNVLNAIALSQMPLVPDIPDFHLMVGSAEELAPLPLLIYQQYHNYNIKPLMEPTNNLSKEKVDLPLEGTEYTVDDFVTNTFYLGNPIDGG